MLPGRARVAECGAAPRCRGARSARLSDPPVRVETCRASRCCSEPSTRSACGTSARRNLQYLHVHKPQVSRLGLCAERCGKEPWCSTPKRVHEAPPSEQSSMSFSAQRILQNQHRVQAMRRRSARVRAAQDGCAACVRAIGNGQCTLCVPGRERAAASALFCGMRMNSAE